MAKNARLLELGPANIYLFLRPKASLLLDNTPSDVNAQVFVQAFKGGNLTPDRPGDAITVAFVDAGAPNVVPATTVTVSTYAITVNLRRSSSAILATADEVIAALTNSPQAAGLVTAARGATGVGTSVVSAHAATPLAGGSEIGVQTDVGFLGDAVAYQVTTETSPLTGAQTGNVPQNKVVVGGMVKVVIPFKEISVVNLQAGVPSARLVSNSDGSLQRVDFSVAVGADLRSLSLQMYIIKIKGGFESSLPQDTIVIPEISPAEGEVNFPFAPTTQREIMTNWYAWPDPVTGRWAYLGTSNP